MSKKNAFSQAFSELISTSGVASNVAPTNEAQTTPPEAKVEPERSFAENNPSRKPSSTLSPAASKATIIAAGTTVEGNMQVEGPAEIQGRFHGNIECSGCLTVSGEIVGGSKIAEIDVQGARIEGNIESNGNVQVRNGAVVVGNVNGQAMQLFGAVKGDIILSGHLTIGSTAIVIGDIQVGSVDIQNGAAINGHVTVSSTGKTSDVFDLDKRNR